MTYFIQKMINRQTSGLEMTLIILAEMFDVVITYVFDKYVWKSKDVPLEKSEVCLLLLATGVFASATPKPSLQNFCSPAEICETPVHSFFRFCH